MRQQTERRKDGNATAINHALELKGTHGTAYAARYLKNHRIASDTIMRVLSDNASVRRPLSQLKNVQAGWPEGNSEASQVTVRQLSYKSRQRLSRGC